MYVSTNTAEECITWEMGTPVTTASNTYPTTPSAFLSNPMTSGLDVTQSVVLAVIRVVYSATGGDLKLSITESNDKRVFVRPTPMYLTPVTTGVVGNKTAVDSHTALDAVNSDSGNLTASRMGAIWQSYNSDGDATLYYSAKDSSNNRHTHVLGPVGYVSASPSGTTTFTFNEGQVFVLNPSTAIQFNPTGTFPLGHKVFVTNEAAHDTNAVTFDNAGIGIVLKGKEAGVFVYTGSAWKNVMLASGAISPNGHGANGLIQLSDGAGGFTSDSKLAWTASPAELTVTGKLTVTGLIDPPGLVLDEKADVAATGHTTAAGKGLIWLKDDAPNRLYFTDDAGTDKKIIHATDSVTELSDVTAVGSGSIITSAERTKLTGIEASATADQTDAEIRAAVEAATDSNVFTDADHTKLNGIEASATADQTAGEIKTAYESNADTNAFTDAEKTKLGTVETNADVTDTANVTAAGALMDSEVTNLAQVKAFDSADYATAAQGAKADSAQQPPSEGGFVNGDKTKLDGIEASADVTDTANVTAAGALMDSEVSNLAQVKAFNSADYATAAQGALADTSLQDAGVFATSAQGALADSAQQPPSEGAFVNGDKTKLDSLASPFEHVRLALTNNSLASQSSGTNYYLELANTSDFSNTGNTTNIVVTNDTQDYVLIKKGGMYMVVVSTEIFTAANTAAQDFWLQLGNGTSSNAERRNWGTARIKRAPSPSAADSALNHQKTVIIDVPSGGSDEKLYVAVLVNGSSFTVNAYDNNRTNITITRIGASTS